MRKSETGTAEDEGKTPTEMGEKRFLEVLDESSEETIYNMLISEKNSKTE